MPCRCSNETACHVKLIYRSGVTYESGSIYACHYNDREKDIERGKFTRE